jgi:AraC family transcriptional activator of pobA
MLEAARLLRFTDLTVGEVGFRAGFTDQLYFSRAFKRHYGEAPMTYRERVRGRGLPA